MSYDGETKVGELLDKALAEEVGLYFQPAWHPQYRASRQRSRSWRIALGSAAVVAAGVLALPFTVQLPQGSGAANNTNLVAIRLPKALHGQIENVRQGAFQVGSMVPVYGTYPMASPTGHNLILSGNFDIGGSTGNSLSLVLSNQMQIQGGMLFSQGTPVYGFTGSNMQGGTTITSPTSAAPAAGLWYSATSVGINTFSNAGSHVYVTHGNLWSDMVYGRPVPLVPSPSDPPQDVVDSIAGLPSQPEDALLLEENPAGLSRGFITQNGGYTWKAWQLGTQSISSLIAISNRYWAILNGTLAWSPNGKQWNNILSLNIKRWQVETYAVDPANPQVVSVALIPISGDGIGPVLETLNGGKSWSEVPNFPAVGAAPTTMVMTSSGDIAALINSNGPVVVSYSPKTRHWSLFPVPAQHNDVGLGQLGASANGNLVYAAPNGEIYQWIRQSLKWLVINPPAQLDASGGTATVLQTIGDNQILVGYPTGWAIFVEPIQEAQGSPPATPRVSAATLFSGRPPSPIGH